MTEISLPDISVSESSYVDPNGFVFYYQDQIFRVIQPEVEGFFRGLFESGLIDKLVKDHHLVETEITDYVIPELKCNLVLKHKAVERTSYCTEWCPSMLKSAARCTLDLNIALLEHGCMLQDAYPWNILFDSTTPVFIDFTSIVPADKRLLWPAYQQFVNFFIYPLKLMSMGKGTTARALLYEYIDGISRKEFTDNITLSYILKHPFDSTTAVVSNRVESFLQNSSKMKEILTNYYQDSSKSIDPEVRRKFLLRLASKLNKIRLKEENTNWSKYYLPSEETDNKQKVISELLDKLKPETMIDIGCNTGRYSEIAARKNIRTVSVDYDEACIERVLARSVQEKLPILPLVMDMVIPTPAFGFLGTQFPSAIERFKSDVVLALAVVHHMHISSRQDFTRIAKLFQILGKKVIVEYVDIEDEMVKQMKIGRDIDYNFDSFFACFDQLFDSVTVHESNKTTRKILLCE